MDSTLIIIPVLLSLRRRCFVNLNEAARFRTDVRTTVSDTKEKDFTRCAVTDRLIATFLLHLFFKDSKCFPQIHQQMTPIPPHLPFADALGLAYLQPSPPTAEVGPSGKF